MNTNKAFFKKAVMIAAVGLIGLGAVSSTFANGSSDDAPPVEYRWGQGPIGAKGFRAMAALRGAMDFGEAPMVQAILAELDEDQRASFEAILDQHQEEREALAELQREMADLHRKLVNGEELSETEFTQLAADIASRRAALRYSQIQAIEEARAIIGDERWEELTAPPAHMAGRGPMGRYAPRGRGGRR